MDSYSARGNTIFVTFTTVLGTMAAFNHATSYLPQFQATPAAEVKLTKIHDMTVNSYLDADQSLISFELGTDFSTEFHWNMKLLFVYLVATYTSESNVRNEITLWDSIVESAEDAKTKLQQYMIEYPLRDQFKQLRSREVTLRLRYRSMPIVGLMREKEICNHTFTTNAEYFRHQKKGQKEPRPKARNSEE